MRREADIVIIGAGIMGLSVAYHLAKNHGRRTSSCSTHVPVRRRERAQRRRRARAVVERGH